MNIVFGEETGQTSEDFQRTVNSEKKLSERILSETAVRRKTFRRNAMSTKD
jgi:hypothetical protein